MTNEQQEQQTLADINLNNDDDSEHRSNTEIYQQSHEERQERGDFEENVESASVPDVDGYNDDESSLESDDLTEEFRHHYTSFLSGTGFYFEYYLPAYEYGFRLAQSPEYEETGWDEYETKFQDLWDTVNSDFAWENFREAIKHAWNLTYSKLNLQSNDNGENGSEDTDE